MATSAFCLSGRYDADLPINMRTFHSATFRATSLFFLLSPGTRFADCRIENMSARILLFRATSDIHLMEHFSTTTCKVVNPALVKVPVTSHWLTWSTADFRMSSLTRQTRRVWNSV